MLFTLSLAPAVHILDIQTSTRQSVLSLLHSAAFPGHLATGSIFSLVSHLYGYYDEDSIEVFVSGINCIVYVPLVGF